ncbi:MAG TPA: SRPBCC family protein [Candidatus Dormibacteraeota bacterium]|nr:SRPBCC family protein [Candidatus Dormibacteraeota bacterium]
MWRNEVSVDINAPIDVVYRRIADFERHGDFSHGLQTVEKATAGPVSVGTQFKAQEIVPARFISYAEITALDAPWRIAWKAWVPGFMRTEWEYVLTSQAGGTHLVQRTQFNGASLPGSLMLHLVRRRQVPRENKATLEAIKVAVEKEALVV